jgi:hypothetical protein
MVANRCLELISRGYEGDGHPQPDLANSLCAVCRVPRIDCILDADGRGGGHFCARSCSPSDEGRAEPVDPAASTAGNAELETPRGPHRRGCAWQASFITVKAKHFWSWAIRLQDGKSQYDRDHGG